ncbi:HP0729 family protein [Campylobacter ureolyticus]|uniref:HP0729 family protein n=1 Tax=Campylobacter ureolyticus TaxID=827 RepID=UPI0022B50472|nr:HP0729 family protein [Campylobacter ureolyticus]MCZ6158052.1 ATP-binding protein [Campylobacter ureolyticus]
MKKNILILYNPYYQSDVIKQHLKVLIENEKVAFGKIKSKFRDMKNDFSKELNEIYKNTNKDNYLQLFLTDYSNLFVAKVIEVSDKDESKFAPSYYKEKNLDVEKWFIITDMRELVRNDFECVRDNFLANFITPNFNDRTYAIYGNAYVYPLIINQKIEVNYFESYGKFYPDVYKSDEFLDIKNSLIKYSFGKNIINLIHPDSIENIISAEIEYSQNIQNPLYDFSSVVVKYSKTMEKEIYIFAKTLFNWAISKNSKIADIEYSVQQKKYTINDIFTNKPNLGTYNFLFKNSMIKDLVRGKFLESYLYKSLSKAISELQDIRNESVHQNPPKFSDVSTLRAKILGVGRDSILTMLIKAGYEIRKWN